MRGLYRSLLSGVSCKVACHVAWELALLFAEGSGTACVQDRHYDFWQAVMPG